MTLIVALPFRVEIPEEAIADLRRRPSRRDALAGEETVTDSSKGVQLRTYAGTRSVLGQRLTIFGRVEERLNARPSNPVTNIDDLNIHFIHVTSRHEGALPLIITHGWPGSIIEMLNVVGPLTDPRHTAARPRTRSTSVIPSMPGYGFSGKPSNHRLGSGPHRPGVGRPHEAPWLRPIRGARGRLGAIIVDRWAYLPQQHGLAIHTNMAGAVPPQIWGISLSNVLGDRVSAARWLSRTMKNPDARQAGVVLHAWCRLWSGNGNRPQTLYGIADSPIGLASWMIDHDAQSYADVTQAFVDKKAVGGLTRDEILDNVTLTWLTNTGVSSARLYWENKHGFFDVKGVSIPVAVSTFPREIYPVPRSWAEQCVPQSGRLQRGGNGESFRGLARTAALFRRASCRLPVPSLELPCRADCACPSLGGPTERPGSTPSPSAPPSCGVTSGIGQLLDLHRHQLAPG